MWRALFAGGLATAASVGAACGAFGSSEAPGAPDAGANDADADADAGADDAAADASSDGCAAQRCVPSVFVGSLKNVTSMAADATALYWSDATTISRRRFDGGAAELLALTNARSALVVDDSAVYWPVGSGIMRIPKDGGTAAPFVTMNYVARVAVDATYLYWTDQNDGKLRRVDKAQPDLDLDAAILDSFGGPNALAVDDASIYVADLSVGLEEVSKSSRAVLRVDGDAYRADSTGDLAAGAGGIFFRSKNRTLETVATLSNHEHTTITSSERVVSQAADESNVFWTEDDPDGSTANGGLRRAAGNGQGAVELASGQLHPSLVVVTADSVYWVVTEPGGTTNAIMRRAK